MTSNPPDILENTLHAHGELLDILLLDRTRTTAAKTHNIIWATDSYPGHKPTAEIQSANITGEHTFLIQPRIAKSREEQKARTQAKAEVFTPKEIVSEMNKTAARQFADESVGWQDYVKKTWLEITCGEGPFIVGRYNAVNGKKVLKLDERVGFLDDKLRIVSKHCHTPEDWYSWAKIAYQNSYGYEWQGDNLLLARENLLYTFIDFWNANFPDDTINLNDKQAQSSLSTPHLKMLREIAEIISWNIFQMDGLRFVIPLSCKQEIIQKSAQISLFDKLDAKSNSKTIHPCPGCASGDPTKHNGKYVKIMDWEKGKTIKFASVLNNK